MNNFLNDKKIRSIYFPDECKRVNFHEKTAGIPNDWSFIATATEDEDFYSSDETFDAPDLDAWTNAVRIDFARKIIGVEATEKMEVEQ